jgi:hypothetical protein
MFSFKLKSFKRASCHNGFSHCGYRKWPPDADNIYEHRLLNKQPYRTGQRSRNSFILNSRGGRLEFRHAWLMAPPGICWITSALAGSEWSASRPGRFTSGERAPGTHWMGGWVGPRIGPDDVEKRKFLTIQGLELRPIGCPARSQSLHRPRYPGSMAYAASVDHFPPYPFRFTYYLIIHRCIVTLLTMSRKKNSLKYN